MFSSPEELSEAIKYFEEGFFLRLALVEGSLGNPSFPVLGPLLLLGVDGGPPERAPASLLLEGSRLTFWGGGHERCRRRGQTSVSSQGVR